MKFVLSNILSNLVCQVETSKSLIIWFVLGTLLIFNSRRMRLFVYHCQGQTSCDINSISTRKLETSFKTALKGSLFL